MTTPVSNSNTVKPQPRAAKPAAPAAKPEASSNVGFMSDAIMNKAPSKEALRQARADVAALASMPSIPLSNSAKKAWLADANARLTKAEKGAELLQDASFWHKSVPNAESDKARDTVLDFKDTIEDCEMRAGLKPYPRPLNPFRPLNQATDAVTGNMGNPVGAVVGVVALPVTIVVDAMDKVTRPVQAVAYPFHWAYLGLRSAGRKLGIG